jgi:serine/threonine protein kinase
MTDTIPMGSSDPGKKADAGVSDSERTCGACGERFTGPVHAACQESDKTIKHTTEIVPAPSSKRTIDTVPAEATPFRDDASRQLNQYILVTQIGKGGMGAVWKAWDRKLTRWVAIKFLLAEDRDGIERFEREAKLAARLRHPNIASIHEVGESTSPTPQLGRTTTHFLVMEFIDGQTLASVKLPQRAILEIFLKVARAIDVAHRGGVVHRDLKPLNIMVTRDQWPYVMDFGLAKSSETESSLSTSGVVMGTPAYMPPEQAEGRSSEVDAQSDVYSLGATMYSVLLGRPPFPGASALEILRRLANDPLTPPRSLDPNLPVDVESILVKSLAKDKKDRYPNAAAMADDIARYLEGKSAPSSAQAAPAAAPPAKKFNPVVVIVALLLIAGGAWYGINSRKEQSMAKPPVDPPAPEVSTPLPPPGSFLLSIAVHPFAEIVRISRDGQPVTLGQNSTPLKEVGLTIGTYEVVLRHPKLGEKKVALPKESLKAGKTYVIWGRMDASLSVDEAP